MSNLIASTYGACDLVTTEGSNLRAALEDAKRRGDHTRCVMISRAIAELEALRAA